MIEVSDMAAEKIQGIMDEQGEQESSLRIIVTGMSCSGPQYMMTLDKDRQEEDHLFESAGLKILLDEDSASVLDGSQIDYLEGLDRSGFTIINPNAGGGGGCGNCGCGK